MPDVPEDEYRWFVASDPNMDDDDTVVTPLPVRRSLGIPVPMPPLRTEEISIDVVDEEEDLPPILPAPAARLPLIDVSRLQPPARTKTLPLPDTKFSQLNTIIGVMREVLASRAAPVAEVEIDAIEWHIRERIAKL